MKTETTLTALLELILNVEKQVLCNTSQYNIIYAALAWSMAE